MNEDQIKNYIFQKFEKYNEQHQSHSYLIGILYFGSRVKYPEEKEFFENSDYDIGIVFSGSTPIIEFPENWDVFLWSIQKWKRGFALQIELATYAKILLDKNHIIKKQFELIQEKILPYWGGYLKKF